MPWQPPGSTALVKGLAFWWGGRREVRSKKEGRRSQAKAK